MLYICFIFLNINFIIKSMATKNTDFTKIVRESAKKKIGRPRGAFSEKNKLLRDMIEEFTDANFNVFSAKMMEIDKPELYAKLYLELLSFRLPKLRSIDFKGDIKNSSLENKLAQLHTESMNLVRASIEEELLDDDV